MSQKTPADVLEEAADLLLIHGRCTGEPHDERGRYCVVGAIQTAAGYPALGFSGEKTDAQRELERALYDSDFARDYLATADMTFRASCDGTPRFPAWIWNDKHHDEDDDFDIIDTLRSVAKDLRNEAKS